MSMSSKKLWRDRNAQGSTVVGVIFPPRVNPVGGFTTIVTGTDVPVPPAFVAFRRTAYEPGLLYLYDGF